MASRPTSTDVAPPVGPPSRIRPLRDTDRLGLRALADERSGRWWRLRAGLPAEPGAADRHLLAGVIAAAILEGPDGEPVGFGSVYEATGHGTAFVEVEVGARAPAGGADRLLAVVLHELARPSALRRVFLRRADGDRPLEMAGWVLQAVLPEAAFFDGRAHDVRIHALDL